jgi:hypothetical protein
MKTRTPGTVVVGLLVSLLATGVAWADNEQLVVTQDESSMERVIEAYLKAEHKLTINEKFIAQDDLVLELPMKGDPMPKYRISIDTQSLNKDDNGKIIERGIRIQTFTGIIVPADKKDAVLRVINDLNRRKVFSAVYIDTDGEIILDWTLNVMAQGLATEYVYDALAREDKLWRELWPLVSPQLQ